MLARAAVLASIVAFALVTAACSPITASIKPLDFPLQFSIDSTGSISVSVTGSVVTPLGEFSVKQGIFNSHEKDDDSTLVVIRHKTGGLTLDAVSTINSTDDLSVDTNGYVHFDFSNRKIFIDDSSGSVQDISIKSLNSATSAVSAPSAAVPSKLGPYSITSANRAERHRW